MGPSADRRASSGSIWGAVHISMLAKCVLRLPPRGVVPIVSQPALSLDRTLPDGEMRASSVVGKRPPSIPHGTRKPRFNTNPATMSFNHKRSLYEVSQGHYGKATKLLSLLGIAGADDPAVLRELQEQHPVNAIRQPLDQSPPALSVTIEAVQATLSRLPRGSSPGWSKMRAQHLLDAISSPAPTCLIALTKWCNHLLSGSGHPHGSAELT